jgi:hypothetical protein
MFISSQRLGLLALAGLAVLTLNQPAQAQVGVAPGLAQANPYGAGAGFNPYAGGAGFFNGRGGYSSGASMSSSPYGGLGSNGYNPYVQPYSYYGDAGGYLIGASAVISASGQLQLQTQQAKILREQYRREKVDTRRKIIEEWLWERNNLPTLQDEMERIQRISLRRMQNDPPVPEILSGQALNELLLDIQRHAAVAGPDITLSEDMLRKVNVSPTGGAVNVGALKNEGRLQWPLSLRNANYRRERDLINQLAGEAYAQAGKGQVDAGVLTQMNESIDRMLADLAANIKEMPPAQYIESKRYLTGLRDATKTLGRNDIANFFNNKYSARGKTVIELVRNMTKDGLRFSPSASGDEAAYMALHRMLAAYDVAINGAVAEREPR